MLSSGFYNSKGGDRKYDAEQFGAMFNGLITDGVFAHYKDALKVTAGSGNRELVVNPGRAWFNGTWTEVDDNGHSIYLMGSAVETTYFVYLSVDKLDRKNTIAWYSNIANNDPEKGLYFYLLAQVTVPGGATKISESMITDTRGSDLCPYVTGIMETVSFEEIVKRVCGDSWQDWLGVYEAGITTGVQNAVATSERALDEVKSLKAYAVESEAVSYIWAKFEAVATGGGGFEWATDSVHTELSDPPMPICLFRNLSYADLGPGFKPNISLSTPYIADGETTVKAIPAVTQSKVWKEYPYFWEGGASFGTEVLRYDDLQRVVVNVGGTATEKYTYRVSRLMHIPVAYEPGEYIGTVSADNATAYPRDGYKDGYYYMRFAAKAEDVSFYYPGLSAKNVQDAIIEVALTGGTGGGSAMSVIEVDELPETGISGVMYVVKKSGDSDAVEYLWLDRWEKIGGTGSAGNGAQGGGGVAVTPQMFGAAGDGETDDTAAIQAMFDSVGDGGLIYFPAGTYVVRHGDTKTGEDYVAVTVRGRHGLRIVLDNGATLLHKTTTVHRYTMLRFDGCDGVEISGGVIEGDRQSHQAVTTSYGSKGIHIVDSVNISVHDMEVREIFGDCIGVTGATVQCDNVLIDKCMLHDSYRNGITIGGAKNSAVRNCHIYGIVGGDPQAGIDLEAERGIPNTDITIDGSYIHDCARNAIAFSSNGTGTRVRNCRLDGNTLFGNTHTGVEITGTTIAGTANFHNDVVLRGCSVTAIGCYDTTDHPGVSLTAYNTIFKGKDGTPTININGINGVATLRLVGCELNQPESSAYALIYSYNATDVDVEMDGCVVNLRNGTALHRQLACGKYRAWSMAGCTIAVRSATMDYSFIRTDADQVRISNCTIDLSGVESYQPAEIAYFWNRNSVIEFNGNVILASVPISNVLCLEGFTGTARITNNTAPMCGAMVKVAGSSGTVVEKGNITANSAEGSDDTDDSSETVQAVNYDLNVKAINHRGYSAESPENTIPAYIMSKQKGFTYVECDVSFTSDGVAVLLHDATIDRTSDGSGNISNMTYAQVLQYDFGSWFSPNYAGVKIPTFTEFVVLCKRLGLHPYIELKSNGSYTQAQISQIVKEVEACGMAGKVTYISFNNTFLGYVKNADASARLGLLANPLNSTKINQAVALKTSTNEVFMDVKLATVTTSLINNCISNGLPLEVWTVNTEKEILEMPSYVSGVTSDNTIAGKVLYNAALTYIPPVSNYVPATGITLDKTSLSFDLPNAQTIVATITPSNASDKVVWKSSNAAVATVSGGVVTPVGDGSCTITATAGSVSATCSVDVAMAQNIHTITRTLVGCTSSSTVASVMDGSSHTETITEDDSYTLEGAEIVITMGGVDISDKFVDGVLSIDAVTADIVINIACVYVQPQPVVDLVLTNVTDGILRNAGTGGSTYDATITTPKSGDSYTSDATGLTLVNHAYANTPYGFKASDKFTIAIRGRLEELNTNQYQRLFRTDQDMPSVFYSYTSGSGLGAKLAGSTSNNFKTHDSRVYIKNLSTGAALNTAYILPENIDEENMHLYCFVCDGSSIYYYIDGVLMASQDASVLKTSSRIGMGDNDESKSYYAAKIAFEMFRIYDFAMTADEVANLI